MNNKFLNNSYIKPTFDDQDRFFPFVFPFLFGGLAGGALVAASRPRPVFVNQVPYGGGYYPYQASPYGSGYSYNSYGHYPYY